MTLNQTHQHALNAIAAVIDLSTKQPGETDYNVCRHCVLHGLTHHELNELCRELEISTRLPKYRKATKLVEMLLSFDADGTLLTHSTVRTVR